jgi:predicted RNA binding protein YcfA (HicA-like mRNA interferase family)
MKRHQLIKHIEKNGCYLYREGKKHSIYVNPKTNKSSTIPRHQEINNFLSKKICRDLDIIK